MSSNKRSLKLSQTIVSDEPSLQSPARSSSSHEKREYRAAARSLSYMLTAFFVLVALVVCQGALWPTPNEMPVAQDAVEKLFTLVRTDDLVLIKHAIGKDKRLAKAADTNGNTLLMAGLEANRGKKIISYLISISDIDAVNNNGETASAFVCRYCSDKSTIRKILTKGKSPVANARRRLLRPDNNGVTPYERSLENPAPAARNFATFCLRKKDIEQFVSSDSAKIDTKNAQTNSVTQDEINEYTSEDDDTFIPNRADDRSTEDNFASAFPSAGGYSSAGEAMGNGYYDSGNTSSPSKKRPLIGDFSSYGEESYSPKNLYDYADTQPPTNTPPVDTTQQSNGNYLGTSTSGYLGALNDNKTVPPIQPSATSDDRDQNGVTRLMTAAKKGNGWEVDALIQGGANVLDADNDGWTALMYAVRYQVNNSIVTSLLNAGSDVYQENNYGFTALTIAARYNENPAITESLVERFKPNDDEVFRSLIVAITATSSEEVRLAKINAFLDHGVLINRYWEGKTPLMYAALSCRNTGALSVLIKNGAIINMVSPDGKKAFDYANENNLLPHDDVFWSLNSK